MPKNHQAIKQPKGECRNDKKVHRCDPIGVIAKECLPPLGWGLPMPCHIFGDRGLTNVDAELEEFAVNPGSTPHRIGETHCPDQLANFEVPLSDISTCETDWVVF